jgi:predicted Zn-dependent protease
LVFGSSLSRVLLLTRNDIASNQIPPYATRINLSKLLIETSQYETAIEVLERLQAEDDQLPDLWYLGGWSLFLLGERAREREPQGNSGEGNGDEEEEAWPDIWEAAREWLTNCLTVCLYFESDLGDGLKG